MSAHVDCRAFLLRVLESERGAAAVFDVKGKALNFRQRCYSHTRAVKKMNMKLYQPDEPMYGKSEYDTISLFIEEKDGKWWVKGYATPEAAATAMEIVDL